ncbi:MAG: hypothetical protein JW966_01465 [Anaerolineae bacterium]|nr:hypothetical protein [Anaerolineae bacterium]
MNRRIELSLVTLLVLLAAVLRIWDLSELPAGFSDNELAHIRLTEAVRQGDVSVYYQVGDGHGRAGMYAILNALVIGSIGDGLLGYRVLVLWGGLLTLALLYILARRLFGPGVALVALALASVNLRLIVLSRTASAESLVPLYTILTLLALAAAFNLRHELRFRSLSTVSFSLLALLFGASGYLHYSTLVLGPLGAAFFAHLLITRQPLSRRVWNMSIYVVVLATVVATPYLTSTLGDPDASEAYILKASRPTDLADAADGVLRAVGGIVWKGDTLVTQNVPEAALIGPLLAVLLILGVIESIRCWRQPGYALLLLALAAGLVTDAWIEPTTTFSANLVAVPAVFVLVALGLDVIRRALHVRGVRQAWQPAAGLVVLIVAVNVIVVRGRVFDTWRHDNDAAALYHTNLGYLAIYLDRTPDDLPVSLCSAQLREPVTVGLSPRQILPLMLHREDLPIRQSDCQTGLVFVNGGAPMRFVFVDPADRDLMPPELADWLADAEPLAVEGLADGTALRLDVEQRISDAGGLWASLAQTFFTPDSKTVEEMAVLPVTFERNLTFVGYDPGVLNPRVLDGAPVVLVTYWRVDGDLPHNLGIFSHMLSYWEDPQTGQRVPRLEPWAEANVMSVIPAELDNRDLFAQVSYIWLNENTRPGDYALMVGAYVGSVYERLGVLDRETGEYRGDRLFLGDVRMVAPSETESGAAPE